VGSDQHTVFSKPSGQWLIASVQYDGQQGVAVFKLEN
jgi:hypothetical protein